MPSITWAARMPELDNNTLVNMMAALDLGCKHLLGNFDTAPKIERALVMRSSAQLRQASARWLSLSTWRCMRS
jgi:hypothetical protein